MQNKYNINLINQYKNEELYEEDLFELILSKTELKELKNNQFDMGSSNGVYIKGNFEAFLYSGIEYDYPKKKIMNEKIQIKWKSELLKPLYFLPLNQKEYVLGRPGYEIFKNINEYLKDLVKGKSEKLNELEERFVIDWFFKEPPSIYLSKDQTQEINELYQILFNQKDYFNKRNEKSTVNNFFENHGMKKILNLLSKKQVNSLMNEKLSHEDILKAYYPKLLRQKHFDLAKQLDNFENEDIVTYLMKNVSDKPEEWFKPFLEKGSALTMAELNNKLLLKPVSMYGKDKKKVANALQGGVDLLRKLQPDLQDPKLIKFMFAAIMEAENEKLYLDLRSFIELPQDEVFVLYMSQRKIHKKDILTIEKEVLKNKLEDKFETKPKMKQSKI